MKKYNVFVIIGVIIFILSSLNTVAYGNEVYLEEIIIVNPEYQLEHADLSHSNRLINTEIHLFTMEASALNQLLSTNGTSKYFYKDSLPSDAYLLYSGVLTTASGNSVTGGIAFVGSDGYINSVDSTRFTSGDLCGSGTISVSNLRSNLKYVGYINGTDSGGTTGYIQYWYMYF